MINPPRTKEEARYRKPSAEKARRASRQEVCRINKPEIPGNTGSVAQRVFEILRGYGQHAKMVEREAGG